MALVRVLQPPGELRGTSDSSVPVLLSIYVCMYFSTVAIPVALADAMAFLGLCVCASLRVRATVCTKFAALWHASLLQKPGLGRMQMSGSKLQLRVRISAKMQPSFLRPPPIFVFRGNLKNWGQCKNGPPGKRTYCTVFNPTFLPSVCEAHKSLSL